MKYVCILLIILGTGLAERASASDSDYSIRNIPILLLPDADAVVRSDHREFTWQSAGRGYLDVKTVITILKSDGNDYAEFSLHYNTFRSVKNISGAVYDSDGKRVRRLRSRDITDEPVISGISIADDYRVKILELKHDTFPYTIELEYRYEYTGLIGFPSWSPSRSAASIQSGKYTVNVPTGVPVIYFSKNLEQKEPVVAESGRMTSYTWKMENQQVERRQPFGPTWEDVAALLMVRTSDFEYGSKSGSLESWQSYGNWMHHLWFGRDELPEDVRNDVLALVEGLESESEIVDTLYRFLQQNTRYVSIQLGIGGLQTETVGNTVRSRYGDCKALTNYMRSLLSAAGISSYPALVRSGHPHLDIVPDFPSSQFNHVILCIPSGADTLWVECTSNAYPAGYIGIGNADKHVLVFNENGGELVKTPKLDSRRNFQRRVGNVTIQPNGDAAATVTTEYGGAQHEHVRHAHLQSTPREKERFVVNTIRIPRFDVTSFDFRLTGEAEAVAMDLELSLPSLATSTSNRLFITPNLMERSTTQLREMEDRTQPVRIRYPYYDVDEFSYSLPAGYSVEVLPSGLHLNEDFGEYISKIEFDEQENILTYYRMLELRETWLPPERYSDFRQFMNTVTRTDAGQVVLVRN